MDFDKAWKKALSETEIIRSRVQILSSYTNTPVPYILLSESSINDGDTVVRKGSVIVKKPALIIPPHNPQFYGFEFDQEEKFEQNSFINFLLIRGVAFPSLKYDNRTHCLDVFEGRLSTAVNHYNKNLQFAEDIKTGLIVAPDDCWQF